MNSSVSASPVNGTAEGTTDEEICLDDCYLLGLLQEGSHYAVVASRLPLSFLLLVFSGIVVVVTRRTARLMERPSATLITNLGATGTVIGGIIILSSVLRLTVTMSFRAVVILAIILPRTLHIAISLTLVCIALDRYLALCHPLRYHALLTDNRCFLLVVLSWLVPFTILGAACIYGRTFKPCTDIRPFLVIYLAMFIGAIVAIVAMYFLIAKEFSRPLDASVNRQDMVVVRRRTAKELMVVLILNLLLATPDILMQIILLKCPKKLPKLYHVVPHLLLVHLLCFYPLYAWKNRDFRSGMLQTFTSYKNSLQKFLAGICIVSVTQLSFRVSFTKLSRTSSTATSSSGLPSPAPTAASAGRVPGLSTSTSSSSLPSAAAVTPQGEDNAVFFT